mgnify:CR=1 FL=1
MSKTQVMEYEPDENEEAVLKVIRKEHRVNPMRVREQTGLRKQYVNDALRQLQKAGVIRKVNRGLYEHVPENDDEYTTDDQELREAVREAREVYEDVDGNGVDDAIARLEELTGADDE